MSGEIALVGGDEFNQKCQAMDRELIRLSGQNPALALIIPTAADQRPDLAASNGVSHFSALGADARPLMVLSREQANDTALLEPLAEAGVIYFTGGNPEHLLNVLRYSRLLQAIQLAVQGGTVLAGSSAGAMVLGAMMRRPSRGGWVEALGLVPGVAVLPHHERADPQAISKQLQEQSRADLTVLGIDAQTACIGKPGAWRVVGSGKVTVYQGSERQGASFTVYHSGEQLPESV